LEGERGSMCASQRAFDELAVKHIKNKRLPLSGDGRE